MSRTNIDIDDELIAACMSSFGLPTNRSAVEFALRRLLASAPGDAEWGAIFGIGWEGDLAAMRRDREFER